MFLSRPQWPHTVEDIVKSLDGVWGVVGATGTNGNLVRLERSLAEPLVYTLIEYEGETEERIARKTSYGADRKKDAVAEFASALGFAPSCLEAVKSLEPS